MQIKPVELMGDIFDIVLYDKRGLEIKKNELSKGEQQLFATALLKALVEESGVNFPVFVDSPLQKFDDKHSSNIIHAYSGTAEPQFRWVVSQCSGNCGATVPVMRATQSY